MDNFSTSQLKKDIRKYIFLQKEKYSFSWKKAASETILSQIEVLPEFINSHTVLLYYALGDEVQTENFLNKWYSSKRILIPLVEGEELILKVFSPDKIVPGYKSIPEPSFDAETVPPEEVELAIVPGVAFDASGNRLGRGKGFYDRLLPKLKCTTIGIGFDFQMVLEIPVEPFDQKLDKILTNC